jgi:hypothetical protein
VTGAVRAADADRTRVAERLRRAHDEGRLDLLEYDERLAAAYAARTYADLAALTADLPSEPARAAAPEPRAPLPHGACAVAGGARPAAARAWASVSALNLLIWAVVCAATVSWVYPWWIWVAIPWGAVLLVGATSSRRVRG